MIREPVRIAITAAMFFWFGWFWRALPQNQRSVERAALAHYVDLSGPSCVTSEEVFSSTYRNDLPECAVVAGSDGRAAIVVHERRKSLGLVRIDP